MQESTITLEVVCKEIATFLISNNLAVPTTAREYDVLATKMRKYHRSTLSRMHTGVTYSKIVKYLDPNIKVGSEKQHFRDDQYYSNKAVALNLDIISEKVCSPLPTQKVTVLCNVCSFTETISYSSLDRRSEGCKKCNKSTTWAYREDEFFEVCAKKDIIPIYTDYHSILNSKEISLECGKCGTLFIRGFNNIINRRYLTDCPKCMPPRVFGKLGLSSVYKGIEFDSSVEVEAYKLLEQVSDNIKVHIPYSTLIGKDTSYISDFVINEKIVLEVTTFREEHHPEYYRNIKAKKHLLQTTQYDFVFCNSLTEVKTFVATII